MSLQGVTVAQAPTPAVTPAERKPRSIVTWFVHQRRHANRLAQADGQALLEYALVLALLGIVSIAVLKGFGVDLGHLVSQSSSRMATVRNP